MSRIGKNPVEVPDGVDVRISGATVTAKGKLGERSVTLPDDVTLEQDGNVITIKPVDESKRSRMMWGTSRSMVNNLITGVADGFTVNLEITGVGYRASVQGQKLQLQLGFSHDVSYPIPQGITIKTPTPTTIEIHGADKQQVGQVASEIRTWRRPEPYKGKGIRYAGEQILRKEGKKK
ncbi:MAG: 50S ribosomal protein L6 [Alphaproteobacteria bacterium]|nr:50S ribosomal protein L6 [Alphaproteobacteria bacterium]